MKLDEKMVLKIIVTLLVFMFMVLAHMFYTLSDSAKDWCMDYCSKQGSDIAIVRIPDFDCRCEVNIRNFPLIYPGINITNITYSQ